MPSITTVNTSGPGRDPIHVPRRFSMVNDWDGLGRYQNRKKLTKGVMRMCGRKMTVTNPSCQFSTSLLRGIFNELNNLEV